MYLLYLYIYTSNFNNQNKTLFKLVVECLCVSYWFSPLAAGFVVSGIQ